MGRARLRLELQRCPKARRKTYETRKKALLKKASELSTLCGVDVCMIMYPPPIKNEETEPFVWSNDPAQVLNLIESHKLSRLGGEWSSSKTCDLTWFYKDQTTKIEEEINKVKKANRHLKYPNCEEKYASLTSEELRIFSEVLTAKLEYAKQTINLLKQRKSFQVPDSSFSMNPPIDPLQTYFDAQSYLENQQRMMMMMIHYHNYNVMNYAPPMSFGMQNVGDSVQGYGEDQLMISSDYFHQVDVYSGFHPNMGF
ncbi:MADS-box transcription factor PHERES 2-like [Dorcoceras hygrometricum]|uniref:MADS-box transcription factor PHERES 2-like n=1 Tax=Dorcoceras hygrometricum TaxID=472368 RepID=A0A2Z7B7Y3_9LAMI|nr:MADS-box transcription factor PHERES 2-like [Dorcoceras hygrometricum]